jgi:hypothetical protein
MALRVGKLITTQPTIQSDLDSLKDVYRRHMHWHSHSPARLPSAATPARASSSAQRPSLWLSSLNSGSLASRFDSLATSSRRSFFSLQHAAAAAAAAAAAGVDSQPSQFKQACMQL